MSLVRKVQNALSAQEKSLFTFALLSFLPKRTLDRSSIRGKGLVKGSCAEGFDQHRPCFGGPKLGPAPICSCAGLGRGGTVLPSIHYPLSAIEQRKPINPQWMWPHQPAPPCASLGRGIGLSGWAWLSKDVTFSSLPCEIHHLCLDILKCLWENTRSAIMFTVVLAHVQLFSPPCWRGFSPLFLHISNCCRSVDPHRATGFYIVISHSSLILLWKALFKCV